MKNVLKKAVFFSVLLLFIGSSTAYADYWVVNYCGDLDSYYAYYVESDIDGMFFTSAGC